jgi:integrase
LAAEIKAEYAALLSGNTSPIVTLGDFCRRFLGAKRAAVSRRTHDYYQGIYDRFLAGTLLASTPINDVRLLDVQDFYDNLFRTGRASAVMLKKIDVFLSMVFRQAMAWEAAIRNPTTAAILPKQSPPEIVALERAQVKTFLEACRSNHKFFIFEFALETFMRPQEYLGLRWSDIDFDQNLIRVQRAIADNFKGGGREIKATKTRHGRRTVAISAQLTARLHEHRALQIYHVQQMRERAQRPALLAHMERTGKNYRIRLDRSKHAKRRAARPLNARTLYSHPPQAASRPSRISITGFSLKFWTKRASRASPSIRCVTRASASPWTAVQMPRQCPNAPVTHL